VWLCRLDLPLDLQRLQHLLLEHRYLGRRLLQLWVVRSICDQLCAIQSQFNSCSGRFQSIHKLPVVTQARHIVPRRPLKVGFSKWNVGLNRRSGPSSSPTLVEVPISVVEQRLTGRNGAVTVIGSSTIGTSTWTTTSSGTGKTLPLLLRQFINTYCLRRSLRRGQPPSPQSLQEPLPLLLLQANALPRGPSSDSVAEASTSSSSTPSPNPNAQKISTGVIVGATV
jgi:hypothetical protein